MSNDRSKGGVIDYSKWDRMNFSDSDDDENDDHDNDENEVGPRVTSLDRPGSVTLRPDGTVEIGSPQNPSNAAVPPSSSGLTPVSTSAVATRSSLSLATTTEDSNRRLERWSSELTLNGGSCIDPHLAHCPVYWTQNRRTVTLRVAFNPALHPPRDVRVEVKGALGYADRCAAVCTNRTEGKAGEGEPSFGTVEIYVLPPLSSRDSDPSSHGVGGLGKDESKTLLLRGELPRPIHHNEDEDEIGFDIEDNLLGGASRVIAIDNVPTMTDSATFTKFATIVLPKASPIEGVVVWWDRPMTHFPTVDVTAFAGRTAMTAMKKNASEKDAAGDPSTFQAAWEEAHASFQEKMKDKKNKKISIEV